MKDSEPEFGIVGTLISGVLGFCILLGMLYGLVRFVKWAWAG